MYMHVRRVTLILIVGTRGGKAVECSLKGTEQYRGTLALPRSPHAFYDAVTSKYGGH